MKRSIVILAAYGTPAVALLAACGAPAVAPMAPKPIAEPEIRPVPDQLAPEPTACADARGQGAICACLRADMLATNHPEPMTDDERTTELARIACDDVSVDGAPSELGFLELQRNQIGSELYLIAGDRIAAKLDVTYTPGMMGIDEQHQIEHASIAGGVARVELVHHHRDSDRGINAITLDDTRYVVLCAGEPLACPLKIPVEYQGSYGELLDDPSTPFTGKASETTWAIAFAITGATVVITPGKGADPLLAGRYSLTGAGTPTGRARR